MPLLKETGGIIITFRKDFEKRILGEGNDVDVMYFKNWKELYLNFDPRIFNILVHPGFSLKFFKKYTGIKHVQVFHGTSDKPYNFKMDLRGYDLIAVPGPKMKEDLVLKGLAETEQIVVIGYPKIDYFLMSNFNNTGFKKQIGIDISKKTVLYAPTWIDRNGYSSFPTYISAVLKSLKNYNVIVKIHAAILHKKPWALVKACIMKRGNSYIFPKSANILPFMAISDILLTDISSVSHEYLPFKKPIIFLNPRPDTKIPDDHTWIWHCGDVVSDKKDIFEVVSDNLAYPSKYQIQRENALTQIFLEFDGKSPQRFKEALQSLY
jgi:CDP-glycerol glycerophosphotransferase (TagB/SpsB family)